MGWDINFHTEIKVNGRWEHYSKLDIRRCYPLFSYLAGVGGIPNIKPITEPRGLPDDCSVVTRIEYERMEESAHSVSFLFKEEMCLVENFLENQAPDWFHGGKFYSPELVLGYLFGNSWSGFSEYPGEYPVAIEDIRWVFWFDA